MVPFTDFNLFLEELGFRDVLAAHGFKVAEGVGVGLKRRGERTLEVLELGEGLMVLVERPKRGWIRVHG